MLKVRKELCVSCGLCAENCPRQAISVQYGRTWINQTRCNRCGICLDVCPQGAIVESISVSEADLATTVGSLKQKTDDLMGRIERLGQQRIDSKGKRKA